MKRSTQRALGAIAVLAVALVVLVLLRMPGPTDEEQILSQIASAIAAAQRHDAGGILKIVSAEYHGSTPFDSNVDQLSFFLRRITSQQGPATVSITPPSVQVTGNTAVTVGQVTVRWAGGTYDNPITLNWKKEDGTKWLVFPAKVWRVVGAQYSVPGGGDIGGM